MPRKSGKLYSIESAPAVAVLASKDKETALLRTHKDIVDSQTFAKYKHDALKYRESQRQISAASSSGGVSVTTAQVPWAMKAPSLGEKPGFVIAMAFSASHVY